MLQIFNERAPLEVPSETMDSVKNAISVLKRHIPYIYLEIRDKRTHRYSNISDEVNMCHAADGLLSTLKYWLFDDIHALREAHGFKNCELTDDLGGFKAAFEGGTLWEHYSFSVQGILHNVEHWLEQGYYAEPKTNSGSHDTTPEKEMVAILEALHTMKSFMAHLRAQRTPQINNDRFYAHATDLAL